MAFGALGEQELCLGIQGVWQVWTFKEHSSILEAMASSSLCQLEWVLSTGEEAYNGPETELDQTNHRTGGETEVQGRMQLSLGSLEPRVNGEAGLEPKYPGAEGSSALAQGFLPWELDGFSLPGSLGGNGAWG